MSDFGIGGITGCFMVLVGYWLPWWLALPANIAIIAGVKSLAGIQP